MPAYILHRRQDFSPSCPSGGQWYVCETGSRFVGCCGNQPCEDGCKAGNLQPASFDPTYWSTFPDMGCDAGAFYTCQSTTPPFLGCCKTNPCSLGDCPTESLAGANLLENERLACQYLSTGCQSTSSLTSTSTSSTASFTSSTSSRSSRVSASSSAATSEAAAVVSNPSRGPIIGGAVGGAAAVIIFCILVFLSYKHAARSRNHRNTELVESQSRQSVEKSQHPFGQIFRRSSVSKPKKASAELPSPEINRSSKASVPSPSLSELHADASPSSSRFPSPTQYRPQSYELSATAPPEARVARDSRSSLGLGLNFPHSPPGYTASTFAPSAVSRQSTGQEQFYPVMSELPGSGSRGRWQDPPYAPDQGHR